MSNLSPFAECVILASLHGRCTARGQEFWEQQKGLAAAVEMRVQTLASSSSAPCSSGGGGGDSLLFFAHMLAHSAVIKLASTAAQEIHGREGGSSLSIWSTTTTTTAEQQRAAAAAAEMARLARLLPSSGCFKAHPLLPDPLACAAGYLVGTSSTTARNGSMGVGSARSSHGLAVQQLVRVLKDMQGMNSLARSHVIALDGAI